MKLYIFAISLACAHAFAPAPATTGRLTSLNMNQASGGMSSDVGIPCEEECALESFPNLPPSVHPGVLSGDAMMDLLNHAKENGKQYQSINRRDYIR